MSQKNKFKQTEIGMSEDDYSLKEIAIGADVFSGFAFKSDDLNNEEGIPVVKIGNIHDRQVTLNGSQFFPKELVNDKIAKFFLEDRDVLIAMTGQGSVGRVGQIRLNEEKVLLNQRVGKFIVDGKNLDRDYLYFVKMRRRLTERSDRLPTGRQVSRCLNLPPTTFCDYSEL